MNFPRHAPISGVELGDVVRSRHSDSNNLGAAAYLIAKEQGQLGHVDARGAFELLLRRIPNGDQKASLSRESFINGWARASRETVVSEPKVVRGRAKAVKCGECGSRSAKVGAKKDCLECVGRLMEMSA